MELVLKAKYGEKEYMASKQPDWVRLAGRPKYHNFALQGTNQCGFYCLMNSYQYNGEDLIGNIKDSGYKKIQSNDVRWGNNVLSLCSHLCFKIL